MEGPQGQGRNSACSTPLPQPEVFSHLNSLWTALRKGAPQDDSFFSIPRTGPGRLSWPLLWEPSDHLSYTGTTSPW